MANKNNNRDDLKDRSQEDPRNRINPEGNKSELNPRNLTDNVSTSGEETNTDQSRTDLRKDEKER